MSHEEINAPQRPEGTGGFPTGPQLTPPSLACLDDEERNRLGDAVSAVLAAVRGPGQTVFDMAMDNFVDLGAHQVGHGLQSMVWSAFQAAMLINGMPMHDNQGVHVSVLVQGENLTEADHVMAEMASKFVEATIAGAHSVAMDAWANWCNSLEEGDWPLYCRGIAVLVQQAIYISTAESVELDETGKAVMGENTMQLKPRGQEI